MSSFRTELDVALFNHPSFYITCITRYRAMHEWFYATGRSVFLPGKPWLITATHFLSTDHRLGDWSCHSFFTTDCFSDILQVNAELLKQCTVITSNSWPLPSWSSTSSSDWPQRQQRRESSLYNRLHKSGKRDFVQKTTNKGRLDFSMTRDHYRNQWADDSQSPLFDQVVS